MFGLSGTVGQLIMWGAISVMVISLVGGGALYIKHIKDGMDLMGTNSVYYIDKTKSNLGVLCYKPIKHPHAG